MTGAGAWPTPGLADLGEPLPSELKKLRRRGWWGLDSRELPLPGSTVLRRCRPRDRVDDEACLNCGGLECDERIRFQADVLAG